MHVEFLGTDFFCLLNPKSLKLNLLFSNGLSLFVNENYQLPIFWHMYEPVTSSFAQALRSVYAMTVKELSISLFFFYTLSRF